MRENVIESLKKFYRRGTCPNMRVLASVNGRSKDIFLSATKNCNKMDS